MGQHSEGLARLTQLILQTVARWMSPSALSGLSMDKEERQTWRFVALKAEEKKLSYSFSASGLGEKVCKEGERSVERRLLMASSFSDGQKRRQIGARAPNRKQNDANTLLLT